MSIFKYDDPFIRDVGEGESLRGWETETLWCNPLLQRRRTLPKVVVTGWENTLPQLVQDWQDTILSVWQWTSKIEVLTQEILLLKVRMEQLESAAPTIVPIESLYPEPYEVFKTIPAVVRLKDDEYIATFFDANISATGETEIEAIMDLKDVIVGTYEILLDHDRKKLAPCSKNQLEVLESFIRKLD